MAAAAQTRRRRRARGPVLQAVPAQSSSDLILAFTALELQLSGLAQQGLAGDELDTVRGRQRIRRQAALLISTFRRDYRERMADVLEAAYGDGARLAGARAPSAIRKAAMARLVGGSSQRLDFALDTVGRQFEDVFRQVGLKQAARQLERELPREAAADLMRRELMSKGLTGFVDRAGRRWRLQNYSRMVIATTTSEAGNQGVADAVLAVGRDLVRVSLPEGRLPGCGHHPNDPKHPCKELEGKVLSLTGRTPGYPKLKRIPPFHPFCDHGIAPA